MTQVVTVSYGEGFYIADDGETFRAVRTSLGRTVEKTLWQVIYGEGYWFAAGDTHIYRSADFNIWEQLNWPAKTGELSLANGDLVVTNYGDLYYSTNHGLTWEYGNSPIGSLKPLQYNHYYSKWYIISSDKYIHTSPTTPFVWTQVDVLPTAQNTSVSVKTWLFNGPVIIACGYDYSGAQPAIWYSTNGEDFFKATVPRFTAEWAAEHANFLFYHGGYYHCLGSHGWWKSTNAVDWVQSTSLPFYSGFEDWAFLRFTDQFVVDDTVYLPVYSMGTSAEFEIVRAIHDGTNQLVATCNFFGEAGYSSFVWNHPTIANYIYAQTDLELTMVPANPESVDPNDVSVRLNLTNHGPDDVSGFTVSMYGLSAMTFTSVPVGNVSASSSNMWWTANEVSFPVGTTLTLIVNATRTLPEYDLPLEAGVESYSRHRLDANMSNNIAYYTFISKSPRRFWNKHQHTAETIEVT